MNIEKYKKNIIDKFISSLNVNLDDFLNVRNEFRIEHFKPITVVLLDGFVNKEASVIYEKDNATFQIIDNPLNGLREFYIIKNKSTLKIINNEFFFSCTKKSEKDNILFLFDLTKELKISIVTTDTFHYEEEIQLIIDSKNKSLFWYEINDSRTKTEKLFKPEKNNEINFLCDILDKIESIELNEQMDIVDYILYKKNKVYTKEEKAMYKLKYDTNLTDLIEEKEYLGILND